MLKDISFSLPKQDFKVYPLPFHSLLEFNHEGSGPLTQAVREFGN